MLQQLLRIMPHTCIASLGVFERHVVKGSHDIFRHVFGSFGSAS